MAQAPSRATALAPAAAAAAAAVAAGATRVLEALEGALCGGGNEQLRTHTADALFYVRGGVM